MPRRKDLKRRVRARMKKTGESYTTARAQTLKRQPTTNSRAAASAVGRPAEYARVAGMSDAAVEAKTGRTWEQWVKSLDHHGAETMLHKEIAALIHEKGKLSGWWSQMVAVGYERIKGLRVRGQRRLGQFDASKSKTFHAPVAKLFEAITDRKLLARWLPDAVKVRTATKHRSARLAMKDGATAAFWLTPKGATKTAVSVQQEKLPDKATQERVKAYWSERLAALSEIIG
jgi:hypothetical protein